MVFGVSPAVAMASMSDASRPASAIAFSAASACSWIREAGDHAEVSRFRGPDHRDRARFPLALKTATLRELPPDCPEFRANKRAAGRARDLADLEALDDPQADD